jgi:hypothetical protein
MLERWGRLLLASWEALLQQIGAALGADPTLGGLAFGLPYGRPERSIEPIAGAPAIKSATSRDRRLRDRRTALEAKNGSARSQT